jgi:hypothetical protein
MLSRTSVALSNLRGVVIVIVLAFHSVLPYLASNPAQPHRFGEAPHDWQAFPIIDQQRWIGFDLFCGWQDVSLMSLMFLLAGLLTAPSLARKGSWRYMTDRVWRIGVPFVLAVLFLSPLAYYAGHRATAPDPSFAAFWATWLALPFWSSGPAWFLWKLLALSAMAAALFAINPTAVSALSRLVERVHDRPVPFLLALTAASAAAYVPLAVVYSPWEWGQIGPFSLHLSRPLHYIVFFFAGFALGSYGFDRGLLHCDGPIARRWLAWLVTALVAFGIWGGLTSLTMPNWHESPLALQVAASLAFPPACVACGFALLALCLRFMRTQRTLLDSLSSNAYAIYLVHYVFVVWSQYALLGSELPAVAKAAVVFAVAMGLSWGTSVGFFKLVASLQAPVPARATRTMVADHRR